MTLPSRGSMTSSAATRPTMRSRSVSIGSFLRTDGGHGDAADLLVAAGEAVALADNNLLGNVHQTAGQITGVCRAQSGIGQRLTAAVRALEEFQNRQAFAEVCLNRHFQRAAGRGRHHAAHAGELGNLRNGTTSAGIRHHADRVELVHVVHDLALGRRPSFCSRP